MDHDDKRFLHACYNLTWVVQMVFQHFLRDACISPCHFCPLVLFITFVEVIKIVNLILSWIHDWIHICCSQKIIRYYLQPQHHLFPLTSYFPLATIWRWSQPSVVYLTEVSSRSYIHCIHANTGCLFSLNIACITRVSLQTLLKYASMPLIPLDQSIPWHYRLPSHLGTSCLFAFLACV